MLVRESVFLKLIKDIFLQLSVEFLARISKKQQWTVNNCNQPNNFQGTKQQAKTSDIKEFEVSRTQQIPPENLPKHGLRLLKFILLPPRSCRHRFCPVLVAIVKNDRRAGACYKWTIGKSLMLDTYISELWPKLSPKLIPIWKVRLKHRKDNQICFCAANFWQAEVQKFFGKTHFCCAFLLKAPFSAVNTWVNFTSVTHPSSGWIN